MVLSGVLGGVSLGVLKLNESINKSGAKARIDADAVLAANQMSSFLADPTNCRATIPAVSSAINSVKFKGENRFNVGDLLTGSTTTVTGYRLIYPTDAAKSANLIVSFKKQALSGGGDLTRKIRLYVEVNSDQTIKLCRSIADDDDLWTRGENDWVDDIFFPNSVGTGTDAPRYPLEVKNNFAVVGTGGGHAISYALTFDDTSKPQNESGHPVYMGFRSRGTPDTPFYSLKDDILASFVGRDYQSQDEVKGYPPGSVAYTQYGGSSFYVYTSEDTSDSAKGTYMIFQTTKNGTSIPKTRMTLEHDGKLTLNNPEQSIMHLAGHGDPPGTPDGTFSALYLNAGNSDPQTNSWYVAHKKSNGSLEVGRWNAGSNTPALSIFANGKVGVNALTPSEALHVEGNILANGTVVSSSDARLKKRIVPIENSLSRLLAIQGVRFSWNTPKSEASGPQIGVIAQTVQRSFPETVRVGSDGEMAVAYGTLIAPVIEVIRGLVNDEKDLGLRLARIESENRLLRRYICRQDPTSVACRKELSK